MNNRNGAKLVVALLVPLCQGLAIIGWPALLAVDVMSIGQGGHPYELPFFNVALAGLTTLTGVAVADWAIRRITDTVDRAVETIRAEAADAHARGYAEGITAATSRPGGRLVVVDATKP